MHLKVSGGIHQLAAVNIHNELEMAEEVRAKNSMRDIRYHEHPMERAAEAQVQGEGTLTKCRNTRVVNDLESDTSRQKIVIKVSW